MKSILLFVSLFILVSCTTTTNFFELKPTQVSNYGYWTGQHSNISVATLKLNQNGSGVICQDYHGKAKVQAIKKVDNKIYTQDGSFWTIKSEGPTNLELAYGAGGSYRLMKDDNSLNITPACKQKID